MVNPRIAMVVSERERLHARVAGSAVKAHQRRSGSGANTDVMCLRGDGGVYTREPDSDRGVGAVLPRRAVCWSECEKESLLGRRGRAREREYIQSVRVM